MLHNHIDHLDKRVLELEVQLVSVKQTSDLMHSLLMQMQISMQMQMQLQRPTAVQSPVQPPAQTQTQTQAPLKESRGGAPSAPERIRWAASAS